MIPQTAGFYWASALDINYFNLIVKVEGNAPMLFITYALDNSFKGPRVIPLKPYEITEWGPKIEEP